jgi:hypothetical protein
LAFSFSAWSLGQKDNAKAAMLAALQTGLPQTP